MKPGFQNNKNVSKLPMISKGDTLNLSYFGQQCAVMINIISSQGAAMNKTVSDIVIL